MTLKDKLEQIKYKKNPELALTDALNYLSSQVTEEDVPPKEMELDSFSYTAIDTLVSKVLEKVNKGIDGKDGLPGLDGKVGQTGSSGNDGKDGKTPIRLVDYWTSEDQKKIISDVLRNIKIPTPKDGLSPDINDVVSKAVVELKKQPIDFKDLTGTENLIKFLKSGGFRGGGISNITGLIEAGTNITITGEGTSTEPFIINSTGGSTSLTYKQVAYGSITNTITSDVGFKRDPTNFNSTFIKSLNGSNGGQLLVDSVASTLTQSISGVSNVLRVDNGGVSATSTSSTFTALGVFAQSRTEISWTDIANSFTGDIRMQDTALHGIRMRASGPSFFTQISLPWDGTNLKFTTETGSYNFPRTHGSAGQSFIDDGSGNLSFGSVLSSVNVAAPITGDGTVGAPLTIIGTATQVPYYDAITAEQVSDASFTRDNSALGNTAIFAGDPLISLGVLEIRSTDATLNWVDTVSNLARTISAQTSGLTIGNNDGVTQYNWLWPTTDVAGVMKSDGAGNLSFGSIYGDFISGGHLNEILYIDNLGNLSSDSGFVRTPAGTTQIVEDDGVGDVANIAFSPGIINMQSSVGAANSAYFSSGNNINITALDGAGLSQLINLVAGTGVTFSSAIGSYTFPQNNATAGQTFVNDGAGNISWGNVTSLGGTPTQVLYVDATTGLVTSDTNHIIDNSLFGRTFFIATDGTNSASLEITSGGFNQYANDATNQLQIVANPTQYSLNITDGTHTNSLAVSANFNILQLTDGINYNASFELDSSTSFLKFQDIIGGVTTEVHAGVSDAIISYTSATASGSFDVSASDAIAQFATASGSSSLQLFDFKSEWSWGDGTVTGTSQMDNTGWNTTYSDNGGAYTALLTLAPTVTNIAYSTATTDAENQLGATGIDYFFNDTVANIQGGSLTTNTHTQVFFVDNNASTRTGIDFVPQVITIGMLTGGNGNQIKLTDTTGTENIIFTGTYNSVPSSISFSSQYLADGSIGKTIIGDVSGSNRSLTITTNDVADTISLENSGGGSGIYYAGAASTGLGSGLDGLVIDIFNDLYQLGNQSTSYILMNAVGGSIIQDSGAGRIIFQSATGALNLNLVQKFANNAAAVAGGLVTGDVYQTVVAGDGILKIVQ